MTTKSDSRTIRSCALSARRGASAGPACRPEPWRRAQWTLALGLLLVLRRGGAGARGTVLLHHKQEGFTHAMHATIYNDLPRITTNTAPPQTCAARVWLQAGAAGAAIARMPSCAASMCSIFSSSSSRCWLQSSSVSAFRASWSTLVAHSRSPVCRMRRRGGA